MGSRSLLQGIFPSQALRPGPVHYRWILYQLSCPCQILCRRSQDPNGPPCEGLILQTLLLLSRFSRVRLCATPEMAATRLPRPWDSPGKNTGVGCHCLLQCVKVKSLSHVRFLTTRLLRPWDFPGKNTGVGCHCLIRILQMRRLRFRELRSKPRLSDSQDQCTVLPYSTP